MTNVIVRAVVFGLLTSGTASAGDTKLAAWVAVGDKLMAPVSAMQSPPERTLDTESNAVTTIRDGVAKMQANTDKIAPEDRPAATAYAERAERWAKAEEALLAKERAGREDVVVPLCDDYAELEQLRAAMAKEKANPSGVVDLAELHKLGRMIQETQAAISELTPKYVAFRHHAYTTWEAEGACVEAYAQRAKDDK